MQYRKKPVVVEAVKLLNMDGKYDDRLGRKPEFDDQPIWLQDALEMEADQVGSVTVALVGVALSIHTLEGKHRADVGDYIIKGVKGELYPCKPEIFELTYEPVE